MLDYLIVITKERGSVCGCPRVSIRAERDAPLSQHPLIITLTLHIIKGKCCITLRVKDTHINTHTARWSCDLWEISHILNCLGSHL